MKIRGFWVTQWKRENKHGELPPEKVILELCCCVRRTYSEFNLKYSLTPLASCDRWRRLTKHAGWTLRPYPCGEAVSSGLRWSQASRLRKSPWECHEAVRVHQTSFCHVIPLVTFSQLVKLCINSTTNTHTINVTSKSSELYQLHRRFVFECIGIYCILLWA